MSNQLGVAPRRPGGCVTPITVKQLAQYHCSSFLDYTPPNVPLYVGEVIQSIARDVIPDCPGNPCLQELPVAFSAEIDVTASLQRNDILVTKLLCEIKEKFNKLFLSVNDVISY